MHTLLALHYVPSWAAGLPYGTALAFEGRFAIAIDPCCTCFTVARSLNNTPTQLFYPKIFSDLL